MSSTKLSSKSGHTSVPPKAHNTHLTNIRYPYINKWDKTGRYVEFEIGNIHFSMANAIRRSIISGVKSVGFRNEPYENCTIHIKHNDSPLNNQLLEHRIAMVPINIADVEKFDCDDHLFVIDVINSTNTNLHITTEDFKIKRISSNTWLSDKEVRAFFPPDPISGQFALLTKLRPKYYIGGIVKDPKLDKEMQSTFDRSAEEPVKLYIEAKAVISNGAENGHFNPACCAAYINTVDGETAEVAAKVWIANEIARQNSIGVTPYSEEKLMKRFMISESQRFFHKNARGEPNLFTYKVESVGVIPPLVIFHRAIEVVKQKISGFVANLLANNKDIIDAKPSKQVNGGYDIIVNNEDDTLGNLVQMHLSLMYADYMLSDENRLLNFIGYRRTHPLEQKIIFTIQPNNKDGNNTLEETIKNIIKPGCQEIVRLLNILQSELENTPQFINEIKSI